jgi:hypothetical protein
LRERDRYRLTANHTNYFVMRPPELRSLMHHNSSEPRLPINLKSTPSYVRLKVTKTTLEKIRPASPLDAQQLFRVIRCSLMGLRRSIYVLRKLMDRGHEICDTFRFMRRVHTMP